MTSRFAATLLLGCAALLATAPPASAHAGSGLETTDHRAELLGLEPAVADVRVRLVDDGTRIELDAGRHEVVVLGYEGEPYLRVDADGVFENRRSPATYLNRSLDGETPPPEADADAEPDWRRVGDGPTVRWHDHALHVPPGQRAGGRTVSQWARPLEVDGVAVSLHGRIVTLPSPSPLPWLVLAAVLAVAIVVAGRLAWRATVVSALAVLVVADGARLYGLVFGAPTWLVSRVDVVADAATLSIIGWGLAVAATVLLAMNRRLEAATGAGVAGGVLALTGGLQELADLGAAGLGSALPDAAARAAVAVVLGAGLGTAVAALLELRRASSTPARPAPRSDSGPSPEGGTRTASPARPPSG